ncbi:MAG: hypothetical protein CR980_01960 [Propionibacteriales bacterium]|nr:MAG: hypothetical protein CR980_01960 [Propionibacteriales bacterium]
MTRVFAPGRIEVLGKHTDYAGGRSLLAAVDVGVTATLTEGNQAGLTISSDATQDTVQITSGSPPIGHWATYAATVWHRLQRNFGELPPSRIHLTSTLPLASGMSSSSALVVAVADALVAHYDLDSRPEFAENIDSVEARAEYYGCIENGQSFRSLAWQARLG